MQVTALDLIAAAMVSSFGSKWTTTHGDNFAATSGQFWALELAGLTERHIQRGIAVTVRSDWPPTLAEFRAACLGVISLAAVELQRAGPPVDQQPFTVLVNRHIDTTEIRMADPQRRDRIVARAYAMAREHVLAGGALPAYTPASQQLTVEDERPAPPPIMVTAAEAIAQARKMLGLDRRRPEPEPVKRALPKDCARCNGTRRDPNPEAYHPTQREPGECLACYGSGVEAAYNRTVNPDGTIEEKI